MNLGDIATTLVDVKGKALKPASVKQVVANKAPPRERNYTISPFRAIKDQRINKSAAMIVLLAICSYTNRHGETWVSQQTIADLLEVSRQAVGKQMRRLIELGYLEVVSPSSAHTTARYRVVFDPTKTLEDVKATIPAALQPEQPAPKPVSKEAARERLKEVKRTIQTQPQKLPLEPNQTQPLEVAPKGNSDATKTGLDATSEVATPATTGSCMKGSFKVIKEGIQEVWKKEGFEVASADMRAHERACEVIDAWQIPTELLGDLLHSTKTTCLSRALPLPTSADHFARLGEESVWDLIARLPAKRATA